MDMKYTLNKISNAQDLTHQEMTNVMQIIMSGKASDIEIAAFLMGMRVKGETITEIAAAVAILREKMQAVDAPNNAIDIVGTGGDGAGTLNISTATAILVASAGIPVAKHGNKALSSKSGSSEALQALGVKLDLAPNGVSKCIYRAGIGFMFAPNHHPAMKYVGSARAELGIRTLFNLLGPQSNPANVKQYLLGVYDKKWIEPVASALLKNGATSAWVVHGIDGLDEITTTGKTYVSAIKNGQIENFIISPKDAGLPIADASDLKGDDPAYNAKRMLELFNGEKNPYRDIVLLNASAAFIIAGLVDNLKEGVKLGARFIDEGKTKTTLDNLIKISNEVL